MKELVNPASIESAISRHENMGRVAKHVGFTTLKLSRKSPPKKVAVLTVTYHNYSQA